VTEGTVGTWLKQPGDTVAFDDPLFEVSTDKVDSEIPSPYDGVLLEVLVATGETVPVGTVLARIGEPGVARAGAAMPAPSGGAARTPTHGAAPSVTGRAPADAEPGRMLSPLVRRLAAESGIDLATVTGSGVGGRIRREDVERAVATARTPAPPPVSTPAPAAPTAPAPGAARPEPAAAPTARLDPRDETVPLPKIRLTIAQRMTHSVRTAPHVWTSVEVDLDAIERVRATHKDRFRTEEGMSLTQLAFVARAICDALRAFPNVNSSLDMEAKTRILHHYVNLGIAVDLNEQGLVAPVIRDADTLNLRGLARAIRATAQKATSGKLGPDDLTGSTFTVTSPGPIADYASAPIINQPNSAIMSLNMITRRPVAVGDAIAIHPMTILGFCYDHRAFDGVTASKFMAHVRDSLQDRDWAAELA
ncbi:dihydrolipoamide acetyltransferase family protein, partial [Pseudonocardia sp.]